MINPVRHPLVGVQTAFHVGKRRNIETLSWWRRVLIRAVYFRCKWSSDFSFEHMGIFTDEDVAREVVTRLEREYPEHRYSIKELPINGILPDAPVKFGAYSFPGSEVDYKYRKRTGWLHAVEPSTLQLAHELKAKVGEFAAFVRDG